MLVYGLHKWKAVQKNLDKKLDTEATMQTLSLMEMSSKEVEAKVEAEVKEEGPQKIFTDEYFVGKAKEMEALGAKIKELQGLLQNISF